ncbi:hypothetical protein ACN76_05320, partial [Escherichia coli]
MAMNGVGCR